MEDLTQFIIKKGKNRFKDPDKIVEALQRKARESFRLKPALSSSINPILVTILQTLRALGEALKEVDKAIERESRAFPNMLRSIKGFATVYCTGILSKIGGIHRFLTEDAVAKFAGLTWKRYPSGNFEAEEPHMSKTGNGYLRYYLIEVSNAFRVHKAEYKAYYETKFKEVTVHQHKRGLALRARKPVRFVFALLKKGQLYRANYQQEA